MLNAGRAYFRLSADLIDSSITHLCLCFHGNVIGLNGPISRGVHVFFGKHEWIAIIGLGINGQLSKRGRKGLTTLFNDLVYHLLSDNPLRDVYPLAYFHNVCDLSKKTIGVIHARRQ